ncbi:hypothetical protein ACL0VS_09895 [Chryseobacterium sp. PMSZPI]|uniref:hypothetical protein n=1 Tax=Chryseobacterium sp. PMSZPI TaxID=1033900 RepID=UPI000CB3433A|nr:hypothetical protein CW752_04870 [Chryseobacterium sp. PMSZPI]
MRKFKFYFLLTGVLMLTACTEKEGNEDEVNSVDKNASIETELSVEHLDSTDVLITKHKVWKKKTLVKELIKRDTIPSLGDTVKTIEDGEGYVRTDKTKKDYEFYITVQ